MPEHFQLRSFFEFRIFVKKFVMSAIVIKTDNQNTKILKELAKKLGANVLNINEGQYEDLALGLFNG